jgi:hypothetical protein
MVEQPSKRELYVHQAKRYSWAHPPPCPEWRVLKVGTSEVDFAMLKPLWDKIIGLVTLVMRVPVDGPCVYEHYRALGHVIA